MSLIQIPRELRTKYPTSSNFELNKPSSRSVSPEFTSLGEPEGAFASFLYHFIVHHRIREKADHMDCIIWFVTATETMERVSQKNRKRFDDLDRYIATLHKPRIKPNKFP